MPEKAEEKKDDKSGDRAATALANLTAAFNQLKGEVKANAEKPKDAAPSAQPTKIYTQGELRAAVNAGTITEDQMIATLRKQDKDALAAETDTKIANAVATAERKTRLVTQIDAIIDAHPDLKNNDSDVFKKVATKFSELVANGQKKDDLYTELLAMQLVLGESAAKPKGRAREREAHEETGGGGGGSDRGGGDDDGWSKGLPPKLKTYYQKAIDKGLYKGPTDPKLVAELKRAKGAH